MLALSACEITARFDTTLEADGSGTFGVAVALDRELADQLAVSDGGLEELEGLFERLASSGWETARAEPGGGLELRATRRFADTAGFDAALAELGSARASEGDDEGLGLDGLRLAFGVRTERSFLRTRTVFEGEIDTRTELASDPEVRRLLDAIADVVHFDVRARLPGDVGTVTGDGSVGEGSVEWRPRLGEALRFSATSSALRPGGLLAIFVPSLLLLVAVGWFVALRRARRAAAPHRTIVLEEPAPALGNGRRVIQLDEPVAVSAEREDPALD